MFGSKLRWPLFGASSPHQRGVVRGPTKRCLLVAYDVGGVRRPVQLVAAGGFGWSTASDGRVEARSSARAPSHPERRLGD